MFDKLRYKIAYIIAPDLIDDLESRLSGLLYNVTGGRLSKPNYTLKTMIAEANDYQQRCCDECEEIKRGEWIKAPSSEKDGDAHCSICSNWDWSDCNYCSKYGAKMDGEKGAGVIVDK